MNWYAVRIPLGPHDQVLREALGGLLPEAGSTGVVEEGDGALTAYFSAADTPDEVLDRVFAVVRGLNGRCGTLWERDRLELETLPDQDWNKTWKTNIGPIEVDDQTVILPPWLRESYSGTRHPLVIDPGMAFGTGHHPTTRDCLAAIRRISEVEGLVRGAALDVGSGTGILAIEALRRGFAPVIALDTDPLAVEAAGRNTALNDAWEEIHIIEGSIEQAGDGPFRLITANLVLNTLVELMPRFSALLDQDGRVVFSGTLAEQDPPLRAAIRNADLRIIEERRTEEWNTYVCRKG
jgi:ribosomal protein L11 methyltransferase